MGAPELLELLAFISQKGNEKLLVEIFDEIGARLSMVEVKCLLDRMIDEVGILPDKGIPSGFLASQATTNKRLFLLGHNPMVDSSKSAPSFLMQRRV
jgi:hypothetical protein